MSEAVRRMKLEIRALVHGLAGQAVSLAVALAADVLDAKPLQAVGHHPGTAMQFDERCRAHFVLPVHLLHQQLRIADYLERGRSVLQRKLQRGKKSRILRKIVGLAAEILREPLDWPSAFVFHDHAITRRAGITARA